MHMAVKQLQDWILTDLGLLEKSQVKLKQWTSSSLQLAHEHMCTISRVAQKAFSNPTTAAGVQGSPLLAGVHVPFNHTARSNTHLFSCTNSSTAGTNLYYREHCMRLMHDKTEKWGLTGRTTCAQCDSVRPGHPRPGLDGEALGGEVAVMLWRTTSGIRRRKGQPHLQRWNDAHIPARSEAALL